MHPVLTMFDVPDASLADEISEYVRHCGLRDGMDLLLRSGRIPSEQIGDPVGVPTFKITQELFDRLGIAGAWRALAMLGFDAGDMERKLQGEVLLVAKTAYQVVEAFGQGRLADLFPEGNYTRDLLLYQTPGQSKSAWADMALAHMDIFYFEFCTSNR